VIYRDLFVFLALLLKGGIKVAEAYDIISGPVMALIGGSLAIAKDLINADDESSKTEQDTDNKQNNRKDEESANEENSE